MTNAQRSLRGLDAILGDDDDNPDEPEKATVVLAPPDDGFPSVMHELFGEEEPESVNAIHSRGSVTRLRPVDRGIFSRLWNWARKARVAGDVQGIVGVDMKQVTPYLSAFASGFGGGDDKDKDKDKKEREDKERQRLMKEKEAAEGRTRTALWVVLGLLVAGGVGTGIYFMARKK